MNDLFDQDENRFRPLAERLRPTSLDHYFGQSHVLGSGKPLRRSIENDQLQSMILWGPPGVGKTSLAKLLARLTACHFDTLSAVMAGVKDIRSKVDKALMYRSQGRRTVLFVDEVHRFNKSQQDAFLPYVEDGTFIFIGATTENPSFELNSALLSRARVYKLQSLAESELSQLLDHALKYDEQLQRQELKFSSETSQLVVAAADGDARRLLGMVEMIADIAEPGVEVSHELVREIIGGSVRRFDKGGDVFYEQISALHKSVRGSAPDAALYWFCRMIDGGCDPLYVARRVVRMASEDIGNADPRALTLALNAWDVQERLGSPEGELAIAHAVIYLACAPKSNAVYKAYKSAMSLVVESPSEEVPMHLRNAPTKLMSDMGMGAEYRYAHDEPEGYAAGENYFPESLKDQTFYAPVARGLEGKIKEKLEYLSNLDRHSNRKRYSS
ncbi:replication-associated recombination protein A [Gynuella sp.]|uniref:replication-associated recombination protein A n=1 Tax=Gynuella sp. TaxID=2969146 RepID=UPI003D0EE99D